MESTCVQLKCHVISIKKHLEFPKVCKRTKMQQHHEDFALRSPHMFSSAYNTIAGAFRFTPLDYSPGFHYRFCTNIHLIVSHLFHIRANCRQYIKTCLHTRGIVTCFMLFYVHSAELFVILFLVCLSVLWSCPVIWFALFLESPDLLPVLLMFLDCWLDF